MLRSAIAGLACLVISVPASAQRRASPRPPAGWDTFVRAFDAYASGDSIVGASVLVVANGQVAAHHEYGFADRALGQRVDTATIYHWASITKTLTAIAVLQLRDRSRLSLDDPVTKWIPELRQVHDSFGAIDSVTVRMLLSHVAGFQGPTWPWTRGQPWEPFEPTRWEQLVAMMPYEEVLFAPGSRYSYSNPGFIYLARIIEQISGDPWETYVQKNLLTPLGLTRSYFGVTPYHLAASRSNNYTVAKDSTGRVAVIANGRDFDRGGPARASWATRAIRRGSARSSTSIPRPAAASSPPSTPPTTRTTSGRKRGSAPCGTRRWRYLLADGNSRTYWPYPAAARLSAGMKRSAAELMQ